MAPVLVDGPEWWARATPEKVAVTFKGDELTYAALDEWADRIAADLHARGVKAGDRVGIVAGNSLAYCAAVVGMLKAGAIIVPVATRLTPGEFAVLTDSSQPTAVIADDSTRELAEGALEKTSADFAIVGMSDVEMLREGAPGKHPRPETDPKSPAALIYTSGTTGLPKGVIFSHEMVLGFIHEWGLTEPGFNHHMRVLMVLPLGGAPGTIWGIIHCAVRGATMVLHEGFVPAEALESLEQDRITMMLGVPLLFEAMSGQPGFADADLSAWECGHVGGARVSEKLLKAYSDKGVLLRQIYGMTEAGGSASANLPSEALEHPEHCGIGNMFTKLKVVREDGTECDPGEPGEVLIKGPTVTPGYWGNDEATAEAIKDGWMHSGDLGVMDERGFLKMVDRMKDLIITGGLNVAPTEIENCIVQLDQVEEVAVISADDEKFGETPAAIVRLSGELSAEEIVGHCNENLADYKVPRYVIFTAEPLPRMPSQKVAKRILREQYPDIERQHEKIR